MAAAFLVGAAFLGAGSSDEESEPEEELEATFFAGAAFLGQAYQMSLNQRSCPSWQQLS